MVHVFRNFKRDQKLILGESGWMFWMDLDGPGFEWMGLDLDGWIWNLSLRINNA